MLLRYGCSNYRSISEYQELVFTASENKQEQSEGLITTDVIREKVLPVAQIYGANASGKTNLLLALQFLTHQIMFGASSGKIAVPTFKLDQKYQSVISTFDIDFICNGKHYYYGFDVLDGEVVEEWLHQTTYGKRKSTITLFHRKNGDEYSFSKNLKGQNKTIAGITMGDNLFLSVGGQKKHPLLAKIYRYFVMNYNYRSYVDRSENSLGESIIENNLQEIISAFLSRVDIGATEIKVEKIEHDERRREIDKSLKKMLNESMIKLFSEKLPFPDDLDVPRFSYEIKVQRTTIEGTEEEFLFSEESQGTQALISFLVPALYVLTNGGVLYVDEIESSLHTVLTLRLIELFAEPALNQNGAQLIFSTHDTQLMTYKGVRRESIWLTEKAKDGSTKVTSLMDFAVDKRSNWQKGYIEGRFGAIPFLGYLDKINFSGEANATEKG